MTKAIVAASNKTEEQAMKEMHKVILMNVDDEKAEISNNVQDKINNEIRKYELDEKSKDARQECVAYYTSFNTSRQRTQQRKVSSYDSEIVSNGAGAARIELKQRAKDKNGILRLAAKSAYKIRAIRKCMFDYVADNWGIKFEEFDEAHIHKGSQHVKVPVVDALGFYLFSCINHPLFDGISSIYHTTESQMTFDVMILSDSKTIQQSKETTATLTLLKIPSIIINNRELRDVSVIHIRNGVSS